MIALGVRCDGSERTKAKELPKSQQYRDTCGKCGATRTDRQLGLEKSLRAYVARLVCVFGQLHRVLRDDGTLFLNLGDSYSGGGGFSPDAPSNRNGSKQTTNNSRLYKGRQPAPGFKPKDRLGVPHRVVFALQKAGWYWRDGIAWCLSGGATLYARTQKGGMPVMVKDLTRLDPSTVQPYRTAGAGPYANGAGRKDGKGKNKVLREDSRGGDLATQRVVTVGWQPGCACPPHDPIAATVLDPFSGVSTTGIAALKLGRRYIGIELNESYVELSRRRINAECGLLAYAAEGGS
jgi:hypothetical protein